VLLVAPENFLLFAPLLPEAASGTIEPRHAVIPLREMLRRTQLLVGHVTGIDVEARTAVAQDLTGARHEVSWDQLVLSPGSVPSVIAVPGLVENAVGFKTLPDAIWLRNRVLRQLETADATVDAERRRELLTFTFVGGGYAGVEALAELESLACDALRTYPTLGPGDLRWVLVEAAERLLPGLDARLARYSEDQLRRRGVEVRLGTRLLSCEDGVVQLSDERIAPYRSPTIVWTAGQRPHPLPRLAGLPVDDQGRVCVDDHLRVQGFEGIFALGDAAAVLGSGTPARFAHRTLGLAVTLGKHRGTAQIRQFTFTGPLAWWMGRGYHLLMLPGSVRKLRVLLDWMLALLFPRDVSQLGGLGHPGRLAGPEPQPSGARRLRSAQPAPAPTPR
jgi:NADH dehydrogenase